MLLCIGNVNVNVCFYQEIKRRLSVLFYIVKSKEFIKEFGSRFDGKRLEV